MLTDSIFKIGAIHSVCQDYALHTDKYVIISDGCSSSPNTDIGARIAARSLSFCLDNYFDGDLNTLFKLTVAKMQSAADTIQLKYEALDATIGFIYITNNVPKAVLYGDGNIIYKHRDGLTLINVEFEQNYPVYLSYKLNKDRDLAVRNIENNYKKVTKTFYDLEFNVTNQFNSICEIDYFSIDIPSFEDSAVLITSDGLQSFQQLETGQTSKSYVDVPITDVLKQLTAFKVYTNGFLERRVDRFAEYMQKSGMRHYDDLSIGIVK